MSGRNAGAVIHSHAKEVVLASLLYKGNEFKIRNQHMIKGIWNNVEGRPGMMSNFLII
jgi:methylthioribulose-1-phosphate dehydratase